MKPERLELLHAWLEKHRDRVDVEHGTIAAANGKGTLGWANPRTGYLHTTLALGATSRAYTVHEVIAVAGALDLSGDVQANHRDTDKTNNRLDNLEAVNQSANMRHAWAHGCNDHRRQRHCPWMVGARHYMAKLNPTQTLAIQAEYASGGVTQRSLAHKYGVSLTVINRVIHGQHWATTEHEQQAA